MVELNWIAIVIATLATMVVGSIWYAPKVFGKRWMQLAKIKPSKDKVTTGQMVYLYAGAFFGSLVTSIVLATMAYIVNDFTQWGFLQSTVVTAVLLWLGFTIARIHMHDSFEGRRKQLTALNTIFELVTILVVALIIGLWPA